MSAHFYHPLQSGNRIAIVAPTGGGDLLSQDTIDIATARLKSIGLTPVLYPTTFTSIEKSLEDKQARAKDINSAFADSEIHGVMTVLGGYASCHVLEYLEYDVIAKSRKLFCGYSDATVINSALLACSNLISLSGPHFSSFGMSKGFDYSLESFVDLAFLKKNKVSYKPCNEWANDLWFLDQENRQFHSNKGPYVIQQGKASGVLMGGNLSTQKLLVGTRYMKRFDEDVILYIEDDQESHLDIFDRMLFNLIEAVGRERIKGIVIGRFEQDSHVDLSDLKKIFLFRPFLKDIPIVADMDFGHTTPILSVPYGAKAELSVMKNYVDFIIETK